uniref:(California timema) hypothetical protein n=1 Tax=Timema californicum TaxID=61474 RepID=A0A7R9PGL1_TIMCA|nr:unnamed protein product [Timema californicum]
MCYRVLIVDRSPSPGRRTSPCRRPVWRCGPEEDIHLCREISAPAWVHQEDPSHESISAWSVRREDVSVRRRQQD